MIFTLLELDIIPQYAVAFVSNRGQRDNTRRFGFFEQGHEAFGQGEMAHMIHTELAFPTRTDALHRTGHNPGIVDQKVQLVQTAAHRISKAANRRNVRQIHGGRRDIPFHAG